ncbi:protein adenylyltransferase SelO [Glaciimonas immobilis]|uniref:Protein nucleotidyltransferase YdiU n=1 Tax=Glaciimonas immobilis TaxID=728004 RepID=A0A840RR04_9BURK|nr:YdiU family protein [Glaciimonas immobilis]KAF3999505.1 YdiU family protein [Glaciimonas immobilis]MBB5199031.1 uncharacterized protein YdiU (UPF0061 family) [Glaciimonas immobilis]
MSDSTVNTRKEAFIDLSVSNGFAALPSNFYTRLMPTPVPAPYLVDANPAAGAMIGLNHAAFSSKEFIETFSGNQLLDDSQPLAAVYSGHQFGQWAGQLGDGRAILLGDTPAQDGSAGRIELQLKGAGATPYSRMGDGRAVLRSSIREYLCSEAMAALHIPTSRALSVIGSDQFIMRETPETTAVVTRLAPSFVRFGSFEHWFYNKQYDSLRILADYVIAQFYPELVASENRYHDLLVEVTKRTAHLIAQWQAVGFMHGVMNTDNMSILGLTLDYGPFGFMEAYDPRHICNHTDQQGRYAYNMQPQIGHWNCYALGQTLLPLIGSVEETEDALKDYQLQYTQKFDELMHAKLGLCTAQAEDAKLFDTLFALMQANHTDFTLFFRKLGELKCARPETDAILRDLFIDRAGFDAWAIQYRIRLIAENSQDEIRRLEMHQTNPKYILRNYLAQVAIEKAQNKDYSEVGKLLHILQRPFDEQPEHEHYAALPPDWANGLEVSCSS